MNGFTTFLSSTNKTGITMEIAEIATLIVTASGVTYQAVRQWRTGKQWQSCLKKEIPVSLIYENMEDRYTVVLAFDRNDNLIKKMPQVDVRSYKGKNRINCSLPEDTCCICLLLSADVLNLSGIYCKSELGRLCMEASCLWMAETGRIRISKKAVFEMNLTELTDCDSVQLSVESVSLHDLFPVEIKTDAMAKSLVFDMCRLHSEWAVSGVNIEFEQDHWLTWQEKEYKKLVLLLKTNFTGKERCANIELRTANETFCLHLRQQMMGEHPSLNVSRRLYVCDGTRNETVSFSVIPDSDTARWSVKKVLTSDGGRWWNVNPFPGILVTGPQVVKVGIEAKPANVHSRTAVVSLETGTYPFNQTTDICLMQGLRFDYYIEYPKDDSCSRHAEAIETPLTYKIGDPLKVYTVRVDSNQPWRIVKAPDVDWVQVEEPSGFSDLYSATFTVIVEANAENMRNGFPAARSTILSLITDTGIVKDILIYQGGYVRIKGLYWLDRNLSAGGNLAPVAIPLGLKGDSRQTWGAFFQFGRNTSDWSYNYETDKESWHEGTEETPVKCVDMDPSPEGWRIPSRLELSQLISCQLAWNDTLRGDDKNICLLSDDGVPFYFPLCGHLSHINGSWIDIPHCNRYWSGTAQSSIYGYTLCLELGKQMYITHDMKKYGFPLRCVCVNESII